MLAVGSPVAHDATMMVDARWVVVLSLGLVSVGLCSEATADEQAKPTESAPPSDSKSSESKSSESKPSESKPSESKPSESELPKTSQPGAPGAQPTSGPIDRAPAESASEGEVNAATEAADEPFEPQPQPKVPLINMSVRGANLRNVLGQLADFGKINLVMPGDISGKVTIRLRDVNWLDAMKAVARSHGLGIQRRGNIVYLDRLDRMAAQSESRVRIREAREAAAPLVTRIFKLSYARAADLAPLVKTLLSPRGSVVVDARTNALIVTDVAVRVDQAARQLSR